ncbi:MAG TPA: 23S rRNA (adenine(2503)-C(2))-methyltransferase RlmN, partial [Microthrixaceae bacterium]|nr:23S rRNA (adenine(2503)-C(2))-methyltransferase RlmN [Microthrixaceae bacterium]
MIADSRYDLTIDQLATLIEDQPAYRVRQVWDGLYQRLLAPTEMTDLPKALRERLDREAPPALAAALHLTSASGDTDKILWRLHDETTVETVLMRYDDRVTVCVSTQVGCAMA